MTSLYKCPFSYFPARNFGGLGMRESYNLHLYNHKLQLVCVCRIGVRGSRSTPFPLQLSYVAIPFHVQDINRKKKREHKHSTARSRERNQTKKPSNSSFLANVLLKPFPSHFPPPPTPISLCFNSYEPLFLLSSWTLTSFTECLVLDPLNLTKIFQKFGISIFSYKIWYFWGYRNIIGLYRRQKMCSPTYI